MSSYNTIEKIKYTKNPSEIVSLREYVVFTDDMAEKKHIVFKFSNNMNQRLYAFRYEIKQYDGAGALLCTSTLVHDGFVAEKNATFVPSAKLEVEYACASISAKLEFAAFDNVKWVKGEILDNSYPFERYLGEVEQERGINTVQRYAGFRTVASAPVSPAPKQNFNIKDIYRSNRAKFPRVWTVLVCILVLAFVIGSLVYIRLTSKVFYVDNFRVEFVNDSEVNLCGYTGKETDLRIPAEIGGYRLRKIQTGAFSDSAIQTVTFASTELTIAKDAFANCRSLTTVRSTAAEGEIIVLPGAFSGCSALTVIDMPNATFVGEITVKNTALSNSVL